MVVSVSRAGPRSEGVLPSLSTLAGLFKPKVVSVFGVKSTSKTVLLETGALNPGMVSGSMP